MQIPKEILTEANYEGSRLIEVTDESISKYQEELTSIQKEINPVLDRLNENYYSKADPLYQEVQRLNEQIKPIKEQLRELFEMNKADTEFIEAQEQKAQLVKNKMLPLVNDYVKESLGEFDKALQTVVKDGKLYVEVVDEIEEKIKAVRASKK
jgi:phosphomevalonate kinase